MKTFCKLTAQSPAASYVPLPSFLLQDEALRDISNDAKVLYALPDRASISRQNGYVEPDGTIRLYFTLEQVQTKLHRSRQSATRIFRELEYSGLIVRRKQGLGKPALITLNYPADAELIAVVPPRRASPAAQAGTGHSQPEKTPPLRSLRQGHSRPLRQDKILPRLRQGGSPPAEGKIRPQTAVWCRQFRGEKPLNCKHSRTTKAARQYDFPRSREIEFYLST